MSENDDLEMTPISGSKSIETGTVSISSPNNIGVYGRFRSELKKPYFFLEEANGEHIDVVQSFAPLSPSYPYSTLFIRIVFLSWSLGSLVDSILSTDAENRFIWIGYLTHWGFILSICFQLMAVIITFNRECLKQPNTYERESLNALVKITWFFYGVATPVELMIVLLYWTLDYKSGDSISYGTIYVHAILAVLLLIDGNLISHIPIRGKQIIFPTCVAILYVIWTIIHSAADIGNGNYDGDLLYNVIDWKDKPAKTSVYVVVIITVVNPIMFCIVWYCGLIGRVFNHQGQNSVDESNVC